MRQIIIFFFILWLLPIKSVFAEKKFCVAVVQLSSKDVGNFRRIDYYVKQAKHMGADLVIFPEESLFGWLNPKAFRSATAIPGKYSNQFAAIAKKNNIWISTGIAEQGKRIDKDYSEAYDASILIAPSGKIVLHHRQHNVVRNAFDSCDCPPPYRKTGCSYSQGDLSDIRVATTPLGNTAILVCADAYTYDTTTLAALKKLKPDFVIINWGVAAPLVDSCKLSYNNASNYTSEVAKFLNTAYVVGSNARGNRPYGRFRPSCYCGESALALPSGEVKDSATITENIHLFYVPLQEK